MNPELRLLTGGISEAEYRGWLELGLPLPVARPGWSRRFYRLAYLALALVIAVGLVAAFSVLAVLTWAAMLPRPA